MVSIATRSRPAASGRRAGRRTPPRAPSPWWVDGEAPPHVQFRGATIEIPAVWSTLRDRWESPNGAYFFDAQEAQRAVDFFPEMLRHHIGEFAGDPFELMLYQRILLTRPLFGWKRTIDGQRRFRKLFGFLPKGAGKSPWGAGTGLYLLCCDHEPAAEVYALAGDKAQARTVHENAKIMVEDSPDLLDICEVLKDSIYYADTRSTYQVLSADAETKHGFRPHGAIFDEFHNQPNRDLYEAIWRSMPKRRQPLMILITHAGDNDEGICFEEYEYAKSVLNGHIPDDSCLPVIFEATPEEDWTDEVVWRRVNPGHGITIKHDAIERECIEAQNEPRKQNDFKRFHLNRWVNAAVTWISVDWWDRCKLPMIAEHALAELPCAIGIDMAQKIDLAAAVAVFRVPIEFFQPTPIAKTEATTEEGETIEVTVEDDDGQMVKRTHSLNYGIAIVPMFWLPEETLEERVKHDNIRYDIYRDQGLLSVTEGAIIDGNAIVRYIHDVDHESTQPDLVTRFPLARQAEIGYDPAFATEIAVTLRDRCGYREKTVEVLQNYKHFTEPCQVFEALIKARRVIHGGHRLLRWNLEHTGIKSDDAGRIRPVKPRKATKRIDGIVATLMGLSRVMAMPPPKPKRERGVARTFTNDGFRTVASDAQTKQ